MKRSCRTEPTSYNVVGHNRSDISVTKLRRLADKVYPNGGAEIMKLIEDIDADRMIQL